MPRREYGIVVYGATGYTGKLICAYLAKNAQGTRWAVGGRNKEKLQGVIEQIGAGNQVGVIVADAQDDKAVEKLVASTQAVISAAGPYNRYGNLLVKHCAANGTHYFDLTAETPWVAEMIQKHAVASLQHRTCLVFSCGMDSVPSDIAAYLAAQALGPGQTGQVKCIYKLKDMLSGGTAASSMDVMAYPRHVAKALSTNAYILSPKPGNDKPKTAWATRVGGLWGGFFPMAFHNEQVIRRTWGILETTPKKAKEQFTYGPDFTYREAYAYGGGPIGNFFVTLFLLLGMFWLRFAFVRGLVSKILPSSGQGASDKMLQNGWLQVITEAKSADGSRTATCTINGRGSPGYRLTSIMIAELALAVVRDADRLPQTAQAGGPLTPVTAGGQVYIDRLKKTGLFQIDVQVDGKKTD